MTRSSAFLPYLVLAFVAYGCTCGTPANQPGPLASLTVSPGTPSIKVGNTQEFSAVGSDAGGRTVSGVTVAWSSSDTAVATISNAGLATAVGPGTTTITARSGSITGTATLTVAANGSHLLSVTISGVPYGRVTSTPTGIDCSAGTCTVAFPSGTQVSLNPIALSNATFTGWSGACTGTGTCTLTLGSDQAVTATFTPPPALTVTLSGPGSVSSTPAGISCTTGSCSTNFAFGTQVSLVAIPVQNGTFAGWGGACSGTGTCSVAMNSNQTVTATFIAPPTLTVTVSGPGTVTSNPAGINCTGGSCSSTFANGTQVTLTATPSQQSTFTGWGGACSGTGACSITLGSNQTVTASFSGPPSLSVTVGGTGGGTVTSNPAGISCTAATCSAFYTSGTQVTLTATPATGSFFAGWGGACTGTGTCTVTMNSNQSVTATFTANPTLSVTLSGSGAGSVTSNPAGINCTSGTCTTAFSSGTQVTLTATPTSSSAFTGWSGACSGTSFTCTVTLSSSQSVTATFVPGFVLTVTAGTGGSVASSPAGINCASGAVCTANYASGTSVSLTPTPLTGYLFSNWSGACTGSTVPCTVSMTAAKSVTANWNGPFDFTISNSLPPPPAISISMVPGESRSLAVTLTLKQGAGLPVALSASGLPANVTASFNPTSVTPSGSSTLTLTAGANAPLGMTTVTVTGTYGSTTHTTTFNLQIRSPGLLTTPNSIAIESGGLTALVTEADRVDRVDLSSQAVVKTIASGLTAPYGVAVESSGTTALVTEGNNLTRVDLTTGAATHLSTTLFTPAGLAVEGSGTTALVTDCGSTGCSTSGRLVRVDLSTGTVTPITPTGTGLNTPRGVAIQSGGTTALVAEKGATRLLQVALANGGVTVVANQNSAYGMAGNTEGVAIESGGANALVTAGLDVVRINLSTGVQTRIASVPSGSVGGLALESNGDALIADRYRNSVVRQRVDAHFFTLAPSPQSTQSLFTPYGVSAETSGTVLLTDCGATGCSTSGRVVRVDPTTGLVTQLATGLNTPKEIAVESGGTTALVIAQGTKQLLRVNLGTGTLTPIATFSQSPVGLAIESGGTKALVTAGNALIEVTLSTGAQTPLTTVTGATLAGVTVEGGGTTAAVVDQTHGSLLQVPLAGGAATPIAVGFANPYDVLAESNGTTALVTEGGLSGRVYRVDLFTNELWVLGSALGAPRALALDANGNVLTPEGNRLLSVSSTGGPILPNSLIPGLASPSDIAYESSGSVLMLVDCGFTIAACTTQGSLVRVTPGSTSVTTLATGLATPSALAIEGTGATALVADCGPSNACTTEGRIARITLSSGALTPLTSGLNTPDGITIEPGGATALVVDGLSNGRLLRVNLTDGSYSILASGLLNPRQAWPEASGTTALVAVDNAIVRVDLTTGKSTPLVSTNVKRFAVESGHNTALVVSTGSGTPGLSTSILRLNLATGGVTVIASGLPESAYSIAVNQSDSIAIVSEKRPGTPSTTGLTGILFEFSVP